MKLKSIIKSIIAVAVVSSLTGCAGMEGRDPKLAGYDVTFAGPANAEHIKSVRFETTAKPATPDSLKNCGFRVLRNKSIELNDQKSYVGAFTGNVYNYATGKTVEGGQNVQNASNNRIQGEANISVILEMAIGQHLNHIRFFIDAQATSTGMKYEFLNIERAMQSTGGSNRGFSEVGAHAYAYPASVLNAIKMQVVDEMDSCITRN